MKKIFWAAAAGIMLGTGTSCEKDETPTKQKMEGVWEVTAAYDQNGKNILPQLEVPVVAFHLSSDNTVISTAGPMMMYIVYGDNKYTQIASTVDQVFNYASLDFTGGEFFVGDGVQDRFTLEMKLEGLPGQKTLTTLLNLLGISQSWLNVVIYHKFMDVGVSFNYDDTQMTWDFDNYTKAVYNTKDQYGNYILWQGWPVNNFSRCSFVLKKRSQDISSIVEQHK